MKNLILPILLALIFAGCEKENFNTIPFREPYIGFGCDIGNEIDNYEKRKKYGNSELPDIPYLNYIYAYKGENKYIHSIVYFPCSNRYCEIDIPNSKYEYVLKCYKSVYGEPVITEPIFREEELIGNSYTWKFSDYLIVMNPIGAIQYRLLTQ